MKQINVPITRYNPDTPTDLTVIKDIPKSIRDKSKEILDVVLTLEASKVSSSIQETLEAFPFVSTIFVQGNGQIPDALYAKKDNVWVGYGNYNYLPTVSSNSKSGERITIHGKTFELIFDGDLKIWAERPEVSPLLFFDFFELPVESTPATLSNNGSGDKNIQMVLSNYKKDKRYFAPYICSGSSTRCETNSPLTIKDRITFTTMFNSISREYMDGSEKVIDPEHKAVLMYIRDEFENVKIGICYDKDYNLFYFNKTVLVSLNKTISTNSSIQFSIQLHENTIKVLADDLVVYKTEDGTIKNKKLLFSVCSDMLYGQYANGSAIFGDAMVFFDVLSNGELRLLSEKPRSFYFNSNFSSYSDLDLTDKLNLKQFMESKKFDFSDKNLSKETYLNELKLVSLYETEITYGLADSSYRGVIKTYLEELKLGITKSLVRPSILSEYE
ncbi:MAG: hypothetical protein ACRCZ9_02810 [Fusobacteriaceae bacterium]